MPAPPSKPSATRGRRLSTWALCLLPSVAWGGPRSAPVPGADAVGPTPAAVQPRAVLSEGFDSVAALTAAGWSARNSSAPAGVTQWFQGSPAVFAAQAGVANSYVGANFQNTSGTGTISNWLLTPPLEFLPGNELRFWTRTVDAPAFRDRLEVRVSTAGTSTNVGSDAFGVGDFSILVASINPSLLLTTNCPPTPQSGYPNAWCEIVLGPQHGIPTSGRGRIAFRYYVTNAGPTGGNAEYIGIDSFRFDEGVPAADLAVTQNLEAPVPTLGQIVDIRVSLTNLGPSDATGISLRNELPPQLSYMADNCGAVATSEQLTWSVPQLSLQATRSCSIRARVIAPGSGVASTAIIGSSPNDPNPANNASTQTITGTLGPASAVPATAPALLILLAAALAGMASPLLRRRASSRDARRSGPA